MKDPMEKPEVIEKIGCFSLCYSQAGAGWEYLVLDSTDTILFGPLLLGTQKAGETPRDAIWRAVLRQMKSLRSEHLSKADKLGEAIEQGKPEPAPFVPPWLVPAFNPIIPLTKAE